MSEQKYTPESAAAIEAQLRAILEDRSALLRPAVIFNNDNLAKQTAKFIDDNKEALNTINSESDKYEIKRKALLDKCAELHEPNEPDIILPTLSVDEYISKSKAIFNKFFEVYDKCWKDRPVTDIEINKLGCNGCGCNGMGQIDGYCCYPNDEVGDCYLRYFDDLEYAEKMDEIVWGEDFSILRDCIINKDGK